MPEHTSTTAESREPVSLGNPKGESNEKKNKYNRVSPVIYTIDNFEGTTALVVSWVVGSRK